MQPAPRFAIVGCFAASCSSSAAPLEPDAADTTGLPYASELIAFEPGIGAGFGDSKLPGVVLGPPIGGGTETGSFDVLSLGVQGEIILGFADRLLIDEPGPDLVVFENPFWPNGDASNPFAELAEVSVSADGDDWITWPCDLEGDGVGKWPGCAGWSPTLDYDPFALDPIIPEMSGGDVFDLADLGLSEARFVRIRDLSTDGEAPSAGFDLDAIGLIHFREDGP